VSDRADSSPANAHPPAARGQRPIRVLRLGEEPVEVTTTPAERLAMIWPLTVRAWQLAGRELPRIPREEIPVRVLRPADPAP